jgi:Na+-transporting NADH:ubiquinone oxidoreductase subunit NqrC
VATAKLGRKLLDMVFIVVLGVLSAGVLVVAQSYAAPRARRHSELRVRTNILAAAGVSARPDQIESLFAARARTEQSGAITLYRVDTLVACEFRGPGVWGPIEGIITLDSSLQRIAGVRVLVQEETPGLGDRIKDPDYLAAYSGKSTQEPLELAIRRKATLENEIDAISGATLSSQAMVKVVNDAVAAVRRAKGR